MIPLAHPRRLGLRKSYDQGDHRTGGEMTKREIADAIMEARITCLLERPERRECEAFRLVNAFRKSELLGFLDAAQDYQAWFEKRGLNASVHTEINDIPF